MAEKEEKPKETKPEKEKTKAPEEKKSEKAEQEKPKEAQEEAPKEEKPEKPKEEPKPEPAKSGPKPAYVKFDTPKDTVNRIYEVVTVAKATGKISKGVNETTKAIERGVAKLVVMAEDVSPEELLMHLPILCEEKQVPYAYVPSKIELGKASGINVPTSSIAVTSEGEAKRPLAELSGRLMALKK